MGYAMTPDVSYHAILAMIGATRGGKGTIVRILEQLVGPEHSCARSMNDLGNPHGLEGTLDKRLMVIADASDAPITTRGNALEQLKKISGGDTVSVNPKNRPMINGVKLPVKIVLVANRHPKFLDDSGALAAREIMLVFERSPRSRGSRPWHQARAGASWDRKLGTRRTPLAS